MRRKNLFSRVLSVALTASLAMTGVPSTFLAEEADYQAEEIVVSDSDLTQEDAVQEAAQPEDQAAADEGAQDAESSDIDYADDDLFEIVEDTDSGISESAEEAAEDYGSDDLTIYEPQEEEDSLPDEIILEEETEDEEALAEGTSVQNGDYVLMNIPYQVFYGRATVDTTSGATTKVRDYEKAYRGYDNDAALGTQDNMASSSPSFGVQAYVKVADASALAADQYREVSAADTTTVHYKSHGEEAAREISGKDYLQVAGNYAYYPISASEVPENATYFELTSTGLTKVTAEASSIGTAYISYTDKHVTYKVTPDEAATAILRSTRTYAAEITTSDGQTYGLKHVYQLFKGGSKVEIGWNADTFPGLTGATIASAKFYTESGDYTVTIGEKAKAVSSGTNYVLMNIPYSVFYGSDVAVDTTSGATAKVRNSGTAAFAYNSEKNNATDLNSGEAARGVQVYVAVSRLRDLDDDIYTEITDSTSYNIAYKARGKTTEATLTGKAALQVAGDYAYYLLDQTDVPAAGSTYFTLNSDGQLVRQEGTSAAVGSATISNTDYHADYKFALDAEAQAALGQVTTYAAEITTTDGSTYGLKAVSQVWRGLASEVGWNREDIPGLTGKTIASVKFITKSGDFTVSVSNGEVKDVADSNYVLMNIPYSVFYGEGVTVDTVSGATGKTRNSGTAYKGYTGEKQAAADLTNVHASSGVQAYVRVANLSSLSARNGYTEVTDSTTYDIAYSVHGNARTAALTGKAALQVAGDYAFYLLDASDVPAADATYFELTSDGLVKHEAAATTVGTASISYTDRHADYKIDLDEAAKAALDGKKVYAAEVVTADGSTYGLKHVAQLWRGLASEVGWDASDIPGLNGAAVASVKFYAEDGNYVVTVGEKTIAKDGYVLMNVPYSVFYGAAAEVDTTSGATAKVRNSGTAYRGYDAEKGNAASLTEAAASQGVQAYVKVSSLKALSAYTLITDSTSYDVAYSGRGRTTNTTLTGKDALQVAGDYAYYPLGSDEVPEGVTYLELTDNGFVKHDGQVKAAGSASINYLDYHVKYQLALDETAQAALDGQKVYAAEVTAADGKTYGLVHVAQIWRGLASEIGWNESAIPAGTMISSLKVYTESGDYTVTVNEKTKKVDGTASVSLANWVEGQTPSTPVVESATNGTENVTYTYAAVGSRDSSAEVPTKAGNYTVTATFAGSDEYGAVKASANFSIVKEYVLMNVPYSVFYDNASVDTVSSATGKVRNSGTSYKSYDGEKSAASDVNTRAAAKGIQAYVKVEDATKVTGTVVTDATTYNVSFRARGRQSDLTLTGKDALQVEDDYAYYNLSDEEAPAANVTYLRLTSNGFVKVEAAAAAVGSAAISYTDHHADYKFDLDDAAETALNGKKVYAATVTTSDGAVYGLAHVSQIWRGLAGEVGWSASAIPSLTGKTVSTVKFYTDDGDYTVTVNEKVLRTDGTASVTMADWTYGSTASTPTATSATNSTAAVSYQYKAKEAADSTYTPAVPTDAGDYTIRATFASTDDYAQVSATDDFTILKGTGTASVSIKGWKTNQKANSPVASSATNGTSGVTYAYKVRNAADSTYTSKAPTAAGRYTVRATFAATKNYNAVTATANFTVTQATIRNFTRLRAHESKATKNSITIAWFKMSGASKYVIYANDCAHTLKKVGETTKTSFTQKGLKKGTYYKYRVVAVDSKGNKLAQATIIHVATRGGKYTNAARVKLTSGKSVTLKKGKTSQISASIVSENKSLTIQKHVATTYESTKPAVAKVSSSGKITAVAKGTCYVYVYAQNGVYSRVKVTVK